MQKKYKDAAGPVYATTATRTARNSGKECCCDSHTYKTVDCSKMMSLAVNRPCTIWANTLDFCIPTDKITDPRPGDKRTFIPAVCFSRKRGCYNSTTLC